MKIKLILFVSLIVQSIVFGQSFDLIPLGVYGGGKENNLSAYLLSEKGNNEFICLDAGTLRAGIEKSIENGNFDTTPEEVLKNYIKGYFISHGHLDHLSGLIINSPDDSPKNIYSIPETIDVLKNKYFTNDAWVNFANEGDEPQLGTYTYQRKNDNEVFKIEGTNLTGRIFTLSHVNPNKSSAIIISNDAGESILYLGDTGADRIENSENLKNLWKETSKLVKSDKLKAILIEVSYENERPENLLFGHLTPKLLNEELSVLANLSGQNHLKGLKIIITHIKPNPGNEEKIKKQLNENNPLEVEFIFPKQGKKIKL